MVIYSHGHIDHCFGAHRLSPDVLWGPEEGKGVTGNIDLMAERFVGRERTDLWLPEIVGKMGFNGFETKHFYGDGQIFRLGETVIKAVHAPGHTNDHYCFYFPVEKIMYTSDIDFRPFGPWYGNLESDIDLFVDSINRVRKFKIDRAVSSHEGLVDDCIEDAFDRFLSVFQKREEKILNFLREPRSMQDFIEAALIYRHYPNRTHLLRFFESEMIRKHLERLISKGMVIEDKGKYLLSSF
jgi:glyoxylase-like metal-dependent hydrolase (beta-lactamase superfamily II)